MKTAKRLLRTLCACSLVLAMAICAPLAASPNGKPPYSLTFDADIEVNGEVTVLAEHYGGYKYDARFLIENQSDVPVKYTIRNAHGDRLAGGRVLPHDTIPQNLYQATLKWYLSDGKYSCHFSTGDGSRAKINFKYCVMDSN